MSTSSLSLLCPIHPSTLSEPNTNPKLYLPSAWCFGPYCAPVTWHPDSISRGVFCVSRLQKARWPPPPAAVSDHVTQSQAATLCPASIIAVLNQLDSVHFREGASSFLPVPDWEVDWMNGSMMSLWQEWGKLWSGVEVAQTNNMLCCYGAIEVRRSRKTRKTTVPFCILPTEEM